MIWQPKPKQRITLKYRKTLRHDTGLHGATGSIETVASGVKTKNALVRLDNGRRVVAPRGNLFIEGDQP
jgi:hypothetical protein